jgi:hypothetical protein
MSVKILILKSLEDVIAEVSNINVDTVTITNPFVLNFSEDKTEVGFYPYAPLSKDTSIEISSDWVVSIVEPIDEIKKSYEDRINGQSTSSAE